jgi:hypothetical protein
MEVWKIILLIFFYSRSNIFLFSERTIKFQNIFFAKKLSFRIEVETFFFWTLPSFTIWLLLQSFTAGSSTKRSMTRVKKIQIQIPGGWFWYQFNPEPDRQLFTSSRNQIHNFFSICQPMCDKRPKPKVFKPPIPVPRITFTEYQKRTVPISSK